jgi:hypothetical protein
LAACAFTASGAVLPIAIAQAISAFFMFFPSELFDVKTSRGAQRNMYANCCNAKMRTAGANKGRIEGGRTRTVRCTHKAGASPKVRRDPLKSAHGQGFVSG